MSPRTLLIPLGLILLVSACGAPPKPPLTSPPLNASASAAPISLAPSAIGLPTPQQPVPAGTIGTVAAPTYPTYTFPTAGATTPAPETVSPTPTPSHAARCTGAPTNAQILAKIKDQAGIPKKTLQVDDGPYCSGDWSFSTVEVVGENADQLEPLMVVTTGRDATLAVVAAGSEVCVDAVQTAAPPGIRVLACGF